MLIIYHFVSPGDCEIHVSTGEIFTPLRANVITEFAQGIVCVEDDQRLFGKRDFIYNLFHFISKPKLPARLR